MANNTADKTKELVEAARKRREVEQANSEQPPKTPEQRFSDEELEVLKADAEKMAESKVQAKAATLDGTIDVEAMGDVKGDGGDAKEYADNDPDKALGVPTYLHGLHETRGGVDTITAVEAENHVHARTRAEQERGRAVIEGRAKERAARVETANVDATDGRKPLTRTTIEDDTEEDEKKRAAAKAKADAHK